MTSIYRCAEIVALEHGLAIAHLVGPTRTARIYVPRFEAMALSREFTDSSFPEIGRFFGGRDHTSVMNAVARCAEFQASRPEVFGRMEKYRRLLNRERRDDERARAFQTPIFRSVRPGMEMRF